MNWLFKEEPAHYSFDALSRDGGTLWSGVKNPLAQRHLRAVRQGDRILYYHTGREKAIVGIARAVGDARDDPGDRTGRRAAVDIAPVGKLPRAVPLGEIKAMKMFAAFPLVRISRLSVMPVGDREWRAILRLSETARAKAGKSRTS
ncbi:MAG TPA: EVE domain-containing protein [Candidatus Polarisedimenticolia bacterium]|jgi:predicted RNA-binding protein with PUA-like domain|nr:EVE domain-containing protein [Candidatus Polarisedimenticolia bacterium]